MTESTDGSGGPPAKRPRIGKGHKHANEAAKKDRCKKMIGAVEERKCLYDRGHENFYNDTIVDAGIPIVEGIPIEQEAVASVKKLWESHKKQFSKERSRREQPGFDGAPGYSFYESMLFMNSHIARRTQKKKVQSQDKPIDCPGSQHSAERATNQSASHSPDSPAPHQSTQAHDDSHDYLDQASNEMLVTASTSQNCPPTGSQVSHEPHPSVHPVGDPSVESDCLRETISRLNQEHDDEHSNSNESFRARRMQMEEARLEREQVRVARETAEMQIKAAEEAEREAQQQQSKAAANEKALNKAAADFVVATLNSIDDESKRKLVAKQIMIIIYG